MTIYQDWFPNGVLELVFELEADRLRNLSFDPKVIENDSSPPTTRPTTAR